MKTEQAKGSYHVIFELVNKYWCVGHNAGPQLHPSANIYLHNKREGVDKELK